MATLQQINDGRPSFLTGRRTVVSDDAELIALARDLHNDRMRLVSIEVTDEVVLPPVDTQSLLNFVCGNEWRVRFERDLQSLCAKNDGDLLTTWITIEEFDTLVTGGNMHEGPTALRELLHRLASQTENWKSLGVEEVYFDGYKR